MSIVAQNIQSLFVTLFKISFETKIEFGQSFHITMLCVNLVHMNNHKRCNIFLSLSPDTTRN
jgi:hypothetical protein